MLYFKSGVSHRQTGKKILTTNYLLHTLKIWWAYGTQMAETKTTFWPTVTGVFTWRSPNISQPNFANCLEVSQTWKCMSRNWGFPPPKRGPHYCLFSDHLMMTLQLMRRYFWNETCYRQMEKEFLTAVCPLRSPKFCEFCPQMANANCSVACGAQGWPSDCRQVSK